jgi:diguanylate cyclase (GGDEF)-like protein
MLRTFPRKFAEWIGWNASGLASAAPQSVGSLPAAALDARDVGTAVELISRLSDITTSVVTEVKQHSGNIQSVNDELGAIRNGDVAAVAAAVCKLLVMNQQTQQRLSQAELRLQAQQRQLVDVTSAVKTDSLTGLMNRRGLDDELAATILRFQQKGRASTVFLLDVDHFKRFNDTHGHMVGDLALKRLADVLLSQARESDIVARFGGEEFVVVFGGAQLTTVLARAEAMRTAIGQTTIVAAGKELRITASAGLAELSTGDTVESLLKRADEALYAAKLDGRDCCYSHEGDRMQRLGLAVDQPAAGEFVTSSPPSRAEAVDIAADQFADTTFVGQIARRVAEWRRGGSTFSIVLARVGFPRGGEQPTDEARRTAMRIVQQFARASLRDMDLLTRWKDDGLAILLPGSLVTDAAGVASRLRSAITKHEMPVPHGGLKLSLCAGVAEVIEGNDANRVLRRAWMALDAAVLEGEGKVFLHDGLRPAAAS